MTIALPSRSTPEAPISFACGAVSVVARRLDVELPAVHALAGRLCAAEVRRMIRYRFDRDRRRFIVSRAHLRDLLAERLRTKPERIELACDGKGKPRLAGEHAASGWQFNIARCGDIAIYAFAHGRRVGIDLEAIRPMPDAENIAARFFSAREQAALLALDPDDRLLGFFNCWTRKEAFVKAVGDGLFHPCDAFDVSLAPDEPARILRVGMMRGEDSCWRLDAFSPMDGFVAALVSERGAPAAC